MTILPPNIEPTMEPLSGAVAAMRLGDVSFGEAQLGVWGDAGVEVVENAWVSRADAERLLESSGTLVDERGQTLAKLGDGVEIVASKDSFLVCYSWQLLDVNAALLADLSESGGEGSVHAAANVDGILIVGEGTRVLPGVYVEGTVVIGRNCKIGPNCYIRGATTIGDNCHIGQSVEVKNCLIGSDTNIGHLSYVGDSVLGSGVNFGAGTTTSNLRHDGANHRTVVNGELVDTGRRKFGTVVADGVHTGIHTSIYPGRKLGRGATTLPNATVARDVPAAGA